MVTSCAPSISFPHSKLVWTLVFLSPPHTAMFRGSASFFFFSPSRVARNPWNPLGLLLISPSSVKGCFRFSVSRFVFLLQPPYVQTPDPPVPERVLFSSFNGLGFSEPFSLDCKFLSLNQTETSPKQTPHYPSPSFTIKEPFLESFCPMYFSSAANPKMNKYDGSPRCEANKLTRCLRFHGPPLSDSLTLDRDQCVMARTFLPPREREGPVFCVFFPPTLLALYC